MGLSEYLTSRFHQTPVSRAVRRIPGVRAAGQAWWQGTQARIFYSAFDGLMAPEMPGSPRTTVELPGNEAMKTGAAAGVGDAFTAEMGQWCNTSKFVLLGYQDVYGHILRHLRANHVRLLEVGIGVADPHAPSGMQQNHQAGASLVGWSHYFADSEIHGADIDRRTLKDTDRYRTHYVDQRDDSSLQDLAVELGAPLHVVIDDGLHTPEANAKTVAAFLPLLAPDGVFVVEDILPEFDDLWLGLGGRLRSEYRLTYYPSTLLRQQRKPTDRAGMAVFTRA